MVLELAYFSAAPTSNHVQGHSSNPGKKTNRVLTFLECAFDSGIVDYFCLSRPLTKSYARVGVKT